MMSKPRFTTRQLDAFVAAAALSNFSLAARQLHLTPSAVSNLITELEASLGFQLFERTTRKVSLTAAGREFLPSALSVQRQFHRAANAAADICNRSIEVTRIAAPMSIAAVTLPPIIAEIRQNDPRISVRILDTGVEWLADRVAIGECDLALGPDGNVPAGVTKTKLFKRPWVVWLASTHPLAARDEVRWSELASFDVYAAGRDHEKSLQPHLNHEFVAADASAFQVVDNLSTAFGMAAAGLGVTFSPSYVDPFARRFGLVPRSLVDPVIFRQIALFESTARKLSPSTIVLREMLHTRLGDPDRC